MAARRDQAETRPQTPAASDPEPGFGPPDADELLFATAAELLAMQYIPRDPARFGVRVPAGTATLSVTTVESGWVDTLGQRP